MSRIDRKFEEQTQQLKGIWDAHNSTNEAKIAETVQVQVRELLVPIAAQNIALQERIQKLEERLESSTQCSTSQPDCTEKETNR